MICPVGVVDGLVGGDNRWDDGIGLLKSPIPHFVGQFQVGPQVRVEPRIDRIGRRRGVGRAGGIKPVLEAVGQVGDVSVGGLRRDVDPGILAGLVAQLDGIFDSPALALVTAVEPRLGGKRRAEPLDQFTTELALVFMAR